MAKTWPIASVILAVLWLFVRGVELTSSAIFGELLIGLAVGMSISYASRGLYTSHSGLRHSVYALPYVFLYIAAFLKEVIVANVEVAYRVLAPSLPIRPAVIVFPLRVRSDVAITAIANSISLTPGTLTMDYDEAENALFVHVMHCRDPTEVAAPIRHWEDYALVIFDEELKPGDPVPNVSYESPGETSEESHKVDSDSSGMTEHQGVTKDGK